MSAKAKGVIDSVSYIAADRMVGAEVPIGDLWIFLDEVDGGRQDAVLQCQHHGNGLYGTTSAE